MKTLRSWHQRAVALIAAAAALVACGTAVAQAPKAYAPAEEDFVLLQMQVKKYRLANDLRGYQTPSGVCVDLADVIQSLDIPVRLDKKSRRATGWIFKEEQTFTLDRDQNSVQTMNNTRPLQPGELYDTPEGWCVSTKSLASWLQVKLTVNLRDSLVVLDSEASLPFIESIERKSRAARLGPERSRDLSAYPQARQPYAMWRLPSVDVVAQTDIRSGGGKAQLSRRYELFASGEIAHASYDARLASDTRGTPENLRVRAYRMDPDGRMLGPLKATQVAAGDVELLSGSLAGANSVGRGAFVANRPLQRATSFGSTKLRGVLPLGWDAELYRNGQLLAHQGESGNGRYEFEVPLVFGQNDLEVVLYGPQGQIRREGQTIPVGQGAVPPGKLEYWAGVIEQNRDLITFGQPPPTAGGWHFASGAQFGLDQRTVVGASGHSLVLAGRRRSFAELNLQRALGPMLLNLSAAQEFGLGRAYRLEALGKFRGINVQAESMIVDGDFSSGLVHDDSRSAHRIQFDAIVRSGRIAIPLSSAFRQTTDRTGRRVNEILTRASLILPRVALTGYLIDRNTYGGVGGDDGTRIGVLANTRIAGIAVRGETLYRLTGRERGLESANVTFEKSLSERSDLRLDVDYTARSHQTDFELGYVHQFKRLALRGSGKVGTNGSLGASLGVSFSLGRDPLSGGWRMSSDKLAQRGQAAVAVYLDENGDGHRSPDEKALPGVGINAGSYGSAQPTDAAGHAFVEGLQPYEKVLVSVDESTLPDPFLVPRGVGIVVTPRAGVPAVLELAVTPTGEVEGSLFTDEGTTRPGVALELIAADGSVVARTASEYDGFFLFEKVPYGRYTLRLSAQSERALGMQGVLNSAIELSPRQTLVRIGTVRLRSPTTVAAADSSP